ncbi:MAG: HNH endonuclease [Bernardetiaceae bacterium]|nr:HNH endonuclease [Bernardetiaceae bacterium]
MHISLKNSDKKIKLCRKGFKFMKKKGLQEGWRLHSAGYAVLQFVKHGKIKTLYLHKIFADEFIPKPESKSRLFVRMINGNKLDCRLENLEWATMSELRRQQPSQNNQYYRGVSKDGNRYRAVLYDQGQRVYLGVFDTPEQAAIAYNEESLKRFGVTESLNKLPKSEEKENTENSMPSPLSFDDEQSDAQPPTNRHTGRR